MTITQIAKMAGVSKATVSRYVNQSGYVSEKTQYHIDEILSSKGMHLSDYRKSSSSKGPKTVGVLISEITNPYFSKAIDSISASAEKVGIDVCFHNSASDAQREVHALQAMRRQGVEGIIIIPSVDFDDISNMKRFEAALEEINLPVVLMDASTDLNLHDGVFFDNYAGAFRAMDSMVARGHKTFAFIGNKRVKAVRDRYQGFRKALEANGVASTHIQYFECDVDKKEAYRVAHEFLSNKNRPEVVFTSSTFVTTGFIKAALEHGLVLEKDIYCIEVYPMSSTKFA